MRPRGTEVNKQNAAVYREYVDAIDDKNYDLADRIREANPDLFLAPVIRPRAEESK